MIGDFTVLEQASMTGRGGRLYNVASGATAILAGEPVATVLGATSVTTTANPAGVVSTDYVVGIAATSSTQTASVAGSVEVIPLNSGTTYLVAPAVAATWNTQTKYNDLVGTRVTINLTAGVYTVNATDNSSNGLVVQALDISKYPGKVAIAFRQALSNLA